MAASLFLGGSMSELHVSNATDLAPNPAQKHRERGASLVEYALLIALISLVTIGSVRAIGTSANGKFSAINTAMTTTGATR
jgi:Flp pilus assembly pilin Flp